MGLAFLAPLFALGLAALAIPIVVHLVHRERRESTPFPSLMFLRRVPYRHSRRRKLRDWLLFALRAAAFLLLVAAFSRPLVARVRAGNAADGGGREVVMLLDQSFSMRYTDRWTRARAEARQVISGIAARDRLTIVPFQLTARAVNEGSGDQALLRAALDTLAPTDGGTRYAPAIALARRILTASHLPQRELIVISDFQRSGFDLGDESRLPPRTVVRAVDVVQGNITDRAVRGVELRRTLTGGKEMLTVTAQVGNAGPATRAVEATLSISGRAIERQTVNLPADGGATVTFAPVPVPGAPQGAQVRIAADALPGDDAFNFVFERTPVVPILLVQSASATAERGIFLDRALAIGDRPPFDVLTRRASQVAAGDLTGRQVIILDDAWPSDAIATRMAQLVRDGAGVIIATGESIGARRDRGDSGLLVAPIRPPVDRAGEKGAVLGYVDATHPALALFGAARSGDLSSARFFRYRPIDSASTILARFDDGSGALAERRLGKGRVLQFGSSLDGFWNDLPRQPVFLPFVHQLVRYAADYRERRNAYAVGEAVDQETRAATAAAPPHETARVAESPSGRRVRFGGAGDPPSLVPSEGGIWQLRRVGAPGERPRLVAVNIDSRELEFSRFDPARLSAAVTPPGGETAAEQVPASEIRTSQEREQSLWWYLLLAAAAALAGESLLARRLSSGRGVAA